MNWLERLMEDIELELDIEAQQQRIRRVEKEFESLERNRRLKLMQLHMLELTGSRSLEMVYRIERDLLARLTKQK